MEIKSNGTVVLRGIEPISAQYGYSPRISDNGTWLVYNDINGWVDTGIKAQGERGMPGTNGQDGYTPIKGVDYFDGDKGDKGDKGDNGSDANVTAENIANALGYTPVSELEATKIKEYLSHKLDKPTDSPAVGKILKIKSVNEDGTFLCEWADAPAGGVSDVQVNGTSVVQDGVAGIPLGDVDKYGLIKIGTANQSGLSIYNDRLTIEACAVSQIAARSTGVRPIVPSNVVPAVNSVLCSTAANEQLTAEQQTAAKQRLGIGKTYELIEEITVGDSTTAISREAEPNGTPYDFESIILWCNVAFDGAGNFGFSLYGNNNSVSNIIIGTADTTKRVFASKVIIDGGICDVRSTGAVYNQYGGSAWNSAYASLFDGVKFIDNISKINISHFNGKNFMVGSVIKIYAIRR